MIAAKDKRFRFDLRRRCSLREEIIQNLVDPSARTPPGGQHQPGHPAL